jgi:DNA repair protein RadD
MSETITPYPYQEPIPKLVLDYILNNEGKHPIVALPTGSGKTIVLATFIQYILSHWDDTNIIVLSHVKEIVEQDYNTLVKFFDRDIIGINSNGLGRREVKQITIANIQSVYRNPKQFEGFNLVIIDEAHLIPPTGNGMYRTFFQGLDNPTYFGLTATPYRLGSGYIYGDDDTIFDDMVYDMTSFDNFNQLINDGYLSKLVPKAPNYEMRTDNLHIRGGEFVEKEMSNIFDRDTITEMAVDEIIANGSNYHKWLVFAIDIDHAEHIAEMMIRKGITADVVHSKMEGNRDRVIRRYKRGEFKCLVNVNVLTTGFDSPDIDLIALLRPTMSPVLHVQMIGRGLRIAPGKDHCLVMDFAGNTKRLGPINDVHVHKKRKSAGEGEAITKTCPKCNTIHHPKTKICDVCGHEFQFVQKINNQSGSDDIIAQEQKRWLDVDSVSYKIHKKKNSPDSLQVTYSCGIKEYKEWVCLEHKGYAGHKARHWVSKRTDAEVDTVEDLFEISKSLKVPKSIFVDARGKYPYITNYTWS